MSDPVPSSPRFTVVLGMHRSGSSALTRALGGLGLSWGPDEGLLPPNFDNPEGFFEQREMVAINDAVLAQLGGTWLQVPTAPAGWEASPALDPLRHRARTFLAAGFPGETRAVLKDPRLCLTLPFWAPLLGTWQAVLCVRRPSAIAASLQARHGLDEAQGYRLWALYTRAALDAAQSRVRALLRYEELLRDPVAALRPWSEALGLPSPTATLHALMKPSLDHGPAAAGPWDGALKQSPTGPADLDAAIADLRMLSSRALEAPCPPMGQASLALAEVLPLYRALAHRSQQDLEELQNEYSDYRTGSEQRLRSLSRTVDELEMRWAADRAELEALRHERQRFGARIGRALGTLRQRLIPDTSPQNKLFRALVKPRPRPQVPAPAPADLRQTLAEANLSFPPQAEPRVSVLVPMYGQGRLTLDCLQALMAEAQSVPLEVLLIDDASPDGSGALFEGTPGLRVTRNPRNLGYLRSCNKLALEARGEFLLLLNNDTRLEAGALQAMLQVFETRPDAGLVGAKFLYPDGRLQEAGAQVFADGRAVKRGQGQDETRPEFNRLEEVDYCSGAGVLLRRSLFLSLGGYDEHFLPSHYEDVDLAFDVRQQGLKVYYQPAARIIHWEGATCGPNGPLNHTESNRPKFQKKWSAVLEQGRHPSAAKR